MVMFLISISKPGKPTVFGADSQLPALKMKERSGAKEPDFGSEAGAKELDYESGAKRRKKPAAGSGARSHNLGAGSSSLLNY